jgi:hypothetical protein
MGIFSKHAKEKRKQQYAEEAAEAELVVTVGESGFAGAIEKLTKYEYKQEAGFSFIAPLAPVDEPEPEKPKRKYTRHKKVEATDDDQGGIISHAQEVDELCPASDEEGET